MRRALALALAAWSAAACSVLADIGDIELADPVESPSPTEPAAGGSARAAPPSAATPLDPPDAGDELDAEPEDVDATPDAEGPDVPPALDAAADAPVVMINGCTEDAFAEHDRRAADAIRAVTFPGVGGGAPAYTPKCIRITAGQSVTFAGPFTLFPLAPSRAQGNNPIARTAGGVTVTFSFASPGRFGFRCPRRGAMRGAVEVVAP